MLIARRSFHFIVFITASLCLQAQATTSDALTQKAEVYLEQLVTEQGIGVRLPGTPAEVQAANFIQESLKEMGYDTKRQSFDFTHRRTKESLRSQNIIAEKVGTSGQSIILGAHYDSTSAELGSLGAVDNGASIAVLLAIAKHVSELEQQEYGVTFIAFGAEEVGLVGAYEFVKQASKAQIKNYVGMINLDGIVGSDNLYIHSAHSTPYGCNGDTKNYAFDPSLRNQLFNVAERVTPSGTFQIHPGFDKYPAGETGGWSDHAPFACVGIPIGNFESTNFSINGESGKDGYSQSTHPKLWDCFDTQSMSSCNRENEKKWGKIWHTGNDRLDVLESLFPGRVSKQMNQNITVLSAFFSELDEHIQQMKTLSVNSK